MKTVTIGFLRYNMGKMFHEITERGQSYVLTKSGKPFARLTPLDDITTILPDGTIKGEMPLTVDIGHKRYSVHTAHCNIKVKP